MAEVKGINKQGLQSLKSSKYNLMRHFLECQPLLKKIRLHIQSHKEKGKKKRCLNEHFTFAFGTLKSSDRRNYVVQKSKSTGYEAVSRWKDRSGYRSRRLSRWRLSHILQMKGICHSNKRVGRIKPFHLCSSVLTPI